MKAEVQSAVKKIRNKEEQVNQQKKQQIDSMTRGYDAQKKEATLVMKMNDKNVRIKTRHWSRSECDANTSIQSNNKQKMLNKAMLNSRDMEVVQFQSLGKASSDVHTTTFTKM